VATEDRDSAEAGAEKGRCSGILGAATNSDDLGAEAVSAATEIDEAGAERTVGGRRILIATR
jgi:hypothetical protein